MELHELHPQYQPEQIDEEIEFESNEAFINYIGELSGTISQSFKNLDARLSTKVKAYFTSKLKSNTQDTLRKALRKKITLPNGELLKMSIAVPANFGIDNEKLVGIVTAYLLSTAKTMNELTDAALKDIDMYMTPEFRKRAFAPDDKWDKFKHKFRQIDELIMDQMSKGSGNATTCLVGDVYHSVGQIEENTKALATLAIDESKLKNHLSSIAYIKSRVEVADKIASLSAHPNASKSLIDELETLADGYTLMGKLYYLYFELSNIVLDIRKL